ncbi:hypothetical protein FNV43_RR00260 [Rhamnella rubrinervis]|uniref:Uncharacterized protein n=1 Tax=Rhamnella rubrinervis TaxID=2594499 RepID=A0A8K0HQA2_9ROSA|nr:hypothetical protein FNV43_RR00260 [Rhamnella rubrinervis]
MTIMVMHLDVVAPTIDGLTILEVLKGNIVMMSFLIRDRETCQMLVLLKTLWIFCGCWTDDIASTTVNPLEVSHKTPMEDASKLGHETLATTINPVEVSHKTPIATKPYRDFGMGTEVPRHCFIAFHGVPPMGLYNPTTKSLNYVVAIHEGSTKYLVKAIKEHEDFTTKSALSLEPKERCFVEEFVELDARLIFSHLAKVRSTGVNSVEISPLKESIKLLGCSDPIRFYFRACLLISICPQGIQYVTTPTPGIFMHNFTQDSNGWGRLGQTLKCEMTRESSYLAGLQHVYG